MISPVVRAHPISFSILFLSIFSFGIIGCSSDSGPSLEKTFGIQGQNYCEEVNLVMTKALQIHLEKKESDFPTVYRETVVSHFAKTALEASRNLEKLTGVGFSRDEIIDQAREISDDLLSQDLSALMARSEACEDILSNWQRVNELLEKHAPEYVQVSDASSESREGNPRPFQSFLSVFGLSLDSHSGYSASYSRGGHSYGFNVKAPLTFQLGQKVSEVEVFDVRAPHTQLARGDKIVEFANLETSSARLDTITYEKVSNYSLEAENFIYLESLLLGANKPYLALGILKPGETEIKRILLSASDFEGISLPYVRGTLLKQSVALIEILEFDDNIAADVAVELHRLRAEAKSLAGIIIDLRFNPGGNADEMVKLADLFIDTGNLGIVETRETPSGTVIRATRADQPKGKEFTSEPLVVLVNQDSASASEVFTQIMQESGRGFVIGEQTFGKFIGQWVIDLGFASRLQGVFRVTTSRFKGPSGTCLQTIGIHPDFSVDTSPTVPLRKSLSNKYPQSVSTIADYRKRNVYVIGPKNSRSIEKPKVTSTQPKDRSKLREAANQSSSEIADPEIRAAIAVMLP